MNLNSNLLFINGQRLAGEGKTFTKFFPGDGSKLYEARFTSESQIDSALDSASKAQRIWKNYSITDRSQILKKAAQLLIDRKDHFAELEVWETGKPISEAKGFDVISAAETLEYYASIAVVNSGLFHECQDGFFISQRQALGVCVGIGAWNYPLQIATWKLAPALVMGNSMIFKPSELTPSTAVFLAEVLTQAGLPNGVFNVLYGDSDTGQRLIQDPRVAKISMTGSSKTGIKINKTAAAKLAPVTLELGGKSPLIVREDADLDIAANCAILGNFYTQGEICSNCTRVIVHKSLIPVFQKKLKQAIGNIKIGNPFDEATNMGALISKEHLLKVLDYIELGQNEGAKLLNLNYLKDRYCNNEGYFVEPVVFYDCTPNMRVVREEIFGPVMCILEYEDDEHAIKLANDTEYGLAAGIVSKNIVKSKEIADQIDSGVCWINNYNLTPPGMPFGGMKNSGFGRENCEATLQHYSQIKTIFIGNNNITNPFE